MKQSLFRRALALFLLLLLFCATALPVAAEGQDAPPAETTLSVFDAIRSVFAVRGLADVVLMFEGASLGFLLIFGVCALLFALWGYHLSRALFFSASFAAGWMLGSLIYDPIIATGLFGENPFFLWRYVVYIGLGVVVFCLAKRILRAGVFSAAAISVYLFLSGFAPFELLVDAVAPVEFAYKYLVGRILIALCIGALALSLTKPVMICVTALAGGTLAAVALCVALGFGGETGAVTVIGLVFSCVGALSQFRVGHHHKKKDVHNEEKTTCEDEAA